MLVTLRIIVWKEVSGWENDWGFLGLKEGTDNVWALEMETEQTAHTATALQWAAPEQRAFLT